MSSSLFNMQSRQCPRCGMSWPTTEARCKNCGFLFETAGSGSAFGGNAQTGSPMQGAGQFAGAGWGQTPAQQPGIPQQNANNTGNMGSGMQWNQPQTSSSAQWNQPQPGLGNQWNQPQTGSGMQWGNQSQVNSNVGSGTQWNQAQTNTSAGSGMQWNQSPSQSSMGSGMQWNQSQASNNVGSGVQWNTQSPTDSPRSGWNTNVGTGSGMQWEQQPSGTGSQWSSASASSGNQSNSSFASSPFGSSGTPETPFSNFNQASVERGSILDAPNTSNSIPFTPALDPFASEQKKRPRWGMIIGAIILLLVIIGASVGGVFYFTRNSNIATQSNTPTTTALKSLPTPTSKPLFSDSFANNNNGWRLEKDEKGAFAVSMSKGALTLADNDNKILWEMLPNTKRYGDFQLFVNATLTKGDPNNGGGGYGIYVRSASTQSGDLATYYRFEIYGDGSYSIFKGQSDPANGKVLSPKEVVANTQNAAIQPMGKQNQLVIKAKGPNITFIVNGQTIKSISDSSYLSGTIALFVSNLPNTKPGAEAQFSNLGIYSAE